MAAPGYYFERVDEHRFQPTNHAGGGWDPTELHFSPLGGLIVHAVEQHMAGRSESGLLLGRISFDILGRLGLEECEITVDTARRGLTIELITATVRIAGRTVVHAHAWYLTTVDTTAVAGGGSGPLPPPDTLPSWPMTSIWPGGFVASLDVRPIAPPEPGHTVAWVTTDIELVDGEDVSALAAFIALVDIANGLAARETPTEWMYPNTDLTIHLHRQPHGHWVGLDTTVVFGPTGQGVTSTTLHDGSGPVGYAHQILTVRPAPPR
ncbi:thioesterase family protein [Agromyces sp. Soil535]|uniref:thioesterase family protein n=1 Tax=Agromyces sp. Soil535 TaxID=1736390 RepID=UPI0006F3A328|nr:thioesterase family protein [Agromyces sp. Soil535]KRE30367.1 thioesterase [Agromyces sp. Soil535]